MNTVHGHCLQKNKYKNDSWVLGRHRISIAEFRLMNWKGHVSTSLVASHSVSDTMVSHHV